MKQLRGQEVIDKILDTAEALFYRQGYPATGINQIIDEAGIAKASLYKHFESKADLLVAYLQRFHEDWFRRLSDYIDQIEDPKGKVLAIFDYHKERQFQRKFGGCPFVKANHDAGANDERVLGEIQKAKQHLKALIGKLVAGSGHKNIVSDAELAELVFLTAEGAIVAASIFKREDDLRSARAIIQKLL